MVKDMIKDEALSIEATIELRELFVNEYCKLKNWNKSELTFEQITEIRAHKEWSCPGMLKS